MRCQIFSLSPPPCSADHERAGLATVFVERKIWTRLDLLSTPQSRGEKMSKRLGGIIGCEYKTSSWHLNGCPDDSNIGSQQYNVGDKPTVTLYTYINRHAGTPDKHQTQKQCSTSSNMVVVVYCYIGCKDKATTWYLNGFLDGGNIGSTTV